ncbi:hypothetical protein [Amycolatopsis sp. H20-H5]|uniref:hypothetical protein n=1 Tax=Amycolatopsis sp. H20-H5 TaxID=3046309 RepID=UPI002DBF480A|nr:hypothetical protein [Amycolatopsis sp. H20-H5]MEC3976972.1 hypothetical protein [Amycolatopsis sp. H20-H5]
MSDSQVSDEFVVESARKVVASLAPEELPLFDPVSQAYLRDPRKVLGDRGRPGAVLGSGIDVTIAVLSPVALAVATAVGQQLVDKASGAVVKGGTRLLGRLRGKNKPGERTRITRIQLDELRELAVERARELGLPDEEARKVGDILRASLERGL